MKLNRSLIAAAIATTTLLAGASTASATKGCFVAAGSPLGTTNCAAGNTITPVSSPTVNLAVLDAGTATTDDLVFSAGSAYGGRCTTVSGNGALTANNNAAGLLYASGFSATTAGARCAGKFAGANAWYTVALAQNTNLTITGAAGTPYTLTATGLKATLVAYTSSGGAATFATCTYLQSGSATGTWTNVGGANSATTATNRATARLGVTAMSGAGLGNPAACPATGQIDQFAVNVGRSGVAGNPPAYVSNN